MPDTHIRTELGIEERRDRLRVAVRLHDIESNPLDAEQIEMFEQFNRDGLTDDQRRAVLTARAQNLVPR